MFARSAAEMVGEWKEEEEEEEKAPFLEGIRLLLLFPGKKESYFLAGAF